MPTDMTIANEILRQMGGPAALVMVGGSAHGDETSLTVKFKAKAHKRINCVIITLDPSDTYTVKFCRVWNRTNVGVASFSDVYAEDLKGLIERTTGLYLSLR